MTLRAEADAYTYLELLGERFMGKELGDFVYTASMCVFETVEGVILHIHIGFGRIWAIGNIVEHSELETCVGFEGG